MTGLAGNAPSPEQCPAISVAAARAVTRAVVLVLHGGQEVSRSAARGTDPAVLRMIPFAWGISRRGRSHGVAVWRLRYRYRGWNGTDASPVADARWALDEVRRVHGTIPVVLLGHSMGARVAVRVAGDPAVSTVVLLAPWLPEGEPVRSVQDRRVVILHGDRDGTTSPGDSVSWAARAEVAATSVAVRVIPGGGHAMLGQACLWHRLATAAVLRGLEHHEIATRRERGSGRQ